MLPRKIDHQRVAITPAIASGGLDELADLFVAEEFAGRPHSRIGRPSEPNCLVFLPRRRLMDCRGHWGFASSANRTVCNLRPFWTVSKRKGDGAATCRYVRGQDRSRRRRREADEFRAIKQAIAGTFRRATD